MNYVISGSLGHISKPLAQKLIAAGHSVTIITSNPSKGNEIKSLGASAAIGSVEDKSFLKNVFAKADAVYLMVPPRFDLNGGFRQYQRKVSDNFVDALKTSGVKHAVLLSSVGAHLGKGAGPVDGLAYTEWHLSQEKELNLKILRPSYFYYNLMGQISLVKNMNIFGANYSGTKEKLVLTHTDDIAEVAAQELLSLKFKGKSIEYVASDECYPKDIAVVLGNAVGKPGLPWVEFKDEDTLQGMLKAGLNEEIAKGYVDLGAGLRNGTIQADYWKNKPKLGKVKLKDFAKEFAAAYNS